MQRDSGDMRNMLWTIGHSNHPLEVFLDLLKQNNIEALVDVRSSPYSRYASQFNREALRPALAERGTDYLFFGDLLGGRPDDPRFCDDEGRALYAEMAHSAVFRQGIERLVHEASRLRTAILCGEEDPADCHRRLLVGRVMGERGVTIMHIRGDGRVQSEEQMAADAQFRKTKGQLSLFETEEPPEWKSTRSRSSPKGFKYDSPGLPRSDYPG
jgi:uncharacterized protein (DUF488 family)